MNKLIVYLPKQEILIFTDASYIVETMDNGRRVLKFNYLSGKTTRSAKIYTDSIIGYSMTTDTKWVVDLNG